MRSEGVRAEQRLVVVVLLLRVRGNREGLWVEEVVAHFEMLYTEIAERDGGE